MGKGEGNGESEIGRVGEEKLPSPVNLPFLVSPVQFLSSLFASSPFPLFPLLQRRNTLPTSLLAGIGNVRTVARCMSRT